MEDLEKKIEEAANKCALRCPTMMVNRSSCFIEGAKSPEAKEYWQQGMYTEKDMLSFAKFVSDDPNVVVLDFIAWLRANKKKQ